MTLEPSVKGQLDAMHCDHSILCRILIKPVNNVTKIILNVYMSTADND